LLPVAAFLPWAAFVVAVAPIPMRSPTRPWICDALCKSRNPTILQLVRSMILAQRHEILRLRQMLPHDGLTKPEYFFYGCLLSFP
jgi:hypothetical protein